MFKNIESLQLTPRTNKFAFPGDSSMLPSWQNSKSFQVLREPTKTTPNRKTHHFTDRRSMLLANLVPSVQLNNNQQWCGVVNYRVEVVQNISWLRGNNPLQVCFWEDGNHFPSRLAQHYWMCFQSTTTDHSYLTKQFSVIPSRYINWWLWNSNEVMGQMGKLVYCKGTFWEGK